MTNHDGTFVNSNERTYTIDDVNRLTKEEMVDTSQAFPDEDDRTLSQAGTAERVQLDLTGDQDYADADEWDDTREYNTANELETRDTDSDTNIDHTLAHDAVGNMTEDGEANEFVYDVWGRLVALNNQSSDPVTAYRYNGLNWRIAVQHDDDNDQDLDCL